MLLKMSDSEATVAGAGQTKVKMNYPVFFANAVIGVTLTFVILYGGYYYYPSIPVPKSNDFCDKLVYAIRCCCFPGAIILVQAIVAVGNKRGTTPALNPLSGNEHYLQLEKQMLANTLEQFLVFFLLSLTLITYLEPSEMRIVPLYTIVFVVGRILFRIGYSIGPQYRSAGMFMAFSSTVFMIGLNGYLMYSRGFLYGLDVTELSSSAVHTPGKSEL